MTALLGVRGGYEIVTASEQEELLAISDKTSTAIVILPEQRKVHGTTTALRTPDENVCRIVQTDESK